MTLEQKAKLYKAERKSVLEVCRTLRSIGAASHIKQAQRMASLYRRERFSAQRICPVCEDSACEIKSDRCGS
jgi:hypothetical protein